MVQRKKLIVLLISSLLFAVIWFTQMRKSESTVDETDSHIRTIHEGISISQVGDAIVDKKNENNIAFFSVLMHDPDSIINNKWLFLGTFETEQDLTNDKIVDYKNYKVKQYDLLTKKFIHEYDVSKFVEEQHNNLQVDFGKEVRRLGSKFLLTVDIATEEGKAYPKSVVIDPEKQELSWMDREDLPKDFRWLNRYEPDDYGKQLWILRKYEDPEPYKLLESNGFIATSGGSFSVEVSTSGSAQLLVSTNNLPEKNKKLYTMFPGIKKYRNDPEYSEGYIIFLLDGQPSPEEIMKLFLEDGEEISFDGLTLSADSTIDGKEHAISSFEGYYQWRNYSEDEVVVN